jgi:hypothetical protein
MKAPAANMIVVLGIFSLFSHSIRKVQGAVVNYQLEDADNLRNGETIYYEVDNAFSNKVSILTTHAGYRGSGYADFQDFGSNLLWMVDAPSTGNYEITARYAAGNAREVNLILDGLKEGTFDFKGTGSWSNWKTETIVLPLKMGHHSLKLIAETSTGPNIDWVSLRFSGSSGVGPMEPPAPSPTAKPIDTPPTREESPVSSPANFPESIVLSSNERLERGQFVFSPNGKFKFGLTSDGDLVLQNSRSLTIWNAKVSGGFRCYMQQDGNVIVRQSNNKALWTSNTYNNPDARLVVDDGGRVAVIHGNTQLWLDGIPRGEYKGPSSSDISFPVRGVFYYPWYPETWTVNGKQARFQPDLGFYSSSDSRVAEAHIDAFEYAHIDLSIASWWGPESNLDRARLTLLMDETIAMKSQVKWTIYYEDERDLRPSASVLKEDLDYLKKWFAWHPAWAHKDGRPVIFVYNEGGCEVVDRWMDGANDEWYVVLKLFTGFKECHTQPDHWVSHACVRSRPPLLFSIWPSLSNPLFFFSIISTNTVSETASHFSTTTILPPLLLGFGGPTMAIQYYHGSAKTNFVRTSRAWSTAESLGN